MKRKILISVICLVCFLTIGKVNAAIEIVPSKNGKGTDAMMNISISNSYLTCRQMTEKGGSLYGSTVVPHLATNRDWEAIAFLSKSAYGTNNAGGNRGIEVTIDGVKYCSTTTNATGIMNWGVNPNATRFTQAAGILSSYDPNDETVGETVHEAVAELWKNKDTRFVDLYGTGYPNYGMTLFNWKGSSNGLPVSIRNYFTNGAIGASTPWSTGQTDYTTGKAFNLITFRPVVWNK